MSINPFAAAKQKNLLPFSQGKPSHSHSLCANAAPKERGHWHQKKKKTPQNVEGSHYVYLRTKAAFVFNISAMSVCSSWRARSSGEKSSPSSGETKANNS